MHRFADASTKVPGEHTGQTPSKAAPHLSRGPLLQEPQILQLVASDASWYLPLAHGVHRRDDASMKLPGVQTPQTPSNAPPHFKRAPDAHGSQTLQLAALVSFW